MTEIKLFLTFLLTFIGILTAYGQAPRIEWQNTLGGTDYEILHAITETAADEFILARHSRSNRSGVKAENSNGSILWQHTIGSTSSDDKLFSINRTIDGYIVGGRLRSDIPLVKA